MLFDGEVNALATYVEPCSRGLFYAYVGHGGWKFNGPNDVFSLIASVLVVFSLSVCAFG